MRREENDFPPFFAQDNASSGRVCKPPENQRRKPQAWFAEPEQDAKECCFKGNLDRKKAAGNLKG